ncbi:MAG: hypothetical protein IPK74_35390 [Deltaproteobacteria bacterium]|nr:hypothetical protein [Deltaproteobacteria bacterium]
MLDRPPPRPRTQWHALVFALLAGCSDAREVGHLASEGDGATATGADTEGATSVAATATTSPDTTEADVDTGAGDPVAACGVTLEPSADETPYACVCEFCDVTRTGVTASSGEAMLAACDCICTSAGCGATLGTSTTTTGSASDGGTTDVTDTSSSSTSSTSSTSSSGTGGSSGA